MPAEVRSGLRSYSRGELVAMTSARAVRTAIDALEIVAVMPGRYVALAHARAFAPRAHALAEATGGAVTGEGALFAAGILDGAPGRILVVAPPGRGRPDLDWGTAFTSTAARPVSMRGFLRCAEPAHAVFDAWSRGPQDRAAGTVLAAMQKRAVSPRDLREVAESQPACRDRRGLDAVIAAFERGAHSYLEYEGMATVFRGREFDRFTRQHAVRPVRNLYYLDMYDAATMTAVELDGEGYHTAAEHRESDCRRDAELAGIGIQTIRLTYRQVTRQPEWCREVVRGVLAARATRFAP
ncbi:endonuclease domain-containing protein [Demequina pelophila]|uniref:endonuclease domain-containing protein n=1 Tax=Demequina pelophila TaxID=1638984 RepID=UPI00078558DA|nr:DUF559 domain-containing protein [Demequina pelophila]